MSIEPLPIAGPGAAALSPATPRPSRSSQPEIQAAPRHQPRLDSLRGIAALMVGGFHAGLIASPSWMGQYAVWILSFFFDGRTGVSIFFVLSGLVLGMSLRRSGSVTALSYFHFCGRRFFRLYPAYFASTLLYLMLYVGLRMRSLHGLPIGHGWCDYFADPAPLSLARLISNFCFSNQHLNVASWTLKVEAQAAFLLPFIHAFALRFRARGQVLLLVALTGLSFFPGSGSTRIYLYLFYLGYLIPPVLEAWRAPSLAWRLGEGGWLLAPAMAALAVSHVFAEKGFGSSLGVFFAGVGSMVLLIVILSASSHRMFRVLDHPLVKFLGMVSYSYYLFNLLSVDLVQRAFYFVTGATPTRTFLDWVIVFAGSSLLCVALAALSFYLTERPGIKLGGHFLPSLGKPQVPPGSSATAA